MVKFNESASEGNSTISYTLTKVPFRNEIKKNQKKLQIRQKKIIQYYPSNCQSHLSKLISKLPMEKNVALHKQLFVLHQDKQLKQSKLGPSLQELLDLGLKFTSAQIYKIAIKLMKTLDFFHKNKFVNGGIFPTNLYFSKELQQFYFINMNRIQIIPNKNSKIKFYPEKPSEEFLRSAQLFGSENLKENIIPSIRDEIQNILYLIYFLECISTQRSYKKSEIIQSINLKELYLSIKMFSYGQTIPLAPIITYFATKIQNIQTSNLCLRIQGNKLESYLFENCHRKLAFQYIIQNFPENRLFKKKQITNQESENFCLIPKNFNQDIF